MTTTSPRLALEFRHNDEPIGVVDDAGAVEVFEDLPYVQARFWLGRREWRRHVVRHVAAVPMPLIVSIMRSAYAVISSTPKG